MKLNDCYMGRGKILFTEEEVDLMNSEKSSNSKILGEALIFSHHLNSVLISLCLLNLIFFNLKINNCRCSLANLVK